jgi:hypothetical protein
MAREPVNLYPETPTPIIPGQSTYTPTQKKSTPAKSQQSVSSPGVTAAPAAASTTPNLDANTLANEYGMTAAMLQAYPELNALFQQAVAGQWDAAKFTAELQNTQWFQTMPDTTRKAITMQYTDPASYAKLWGDTQVHIQQLAGAMGVNPYDWGTIQQVAAKVIFNGWSDEQARTELGLHLNFGNGGMVGGSAGVTMQNLNTYAYQMGIKNSDDWTRQQVINISRGLGTEQDAKNAIMQQAEAQFPQYADQIKAGQTVDSLAAPYTQSMTQILEIPAGQVNLFDPTIRNAMSYKNPNGSGSAEPLWQFQNGLRQDPRWGQTQNAQDAAMGTAHKVLQDFGLFS